MGGTERSFRDYPVIDGFFLQGIEKENRLDRAGLQVSSSAWCFSRLRMISRRGGGRPARVYVIGLDGATWDILDPLIEQGKLPVFKKLKENGAWSRLRTFDPTLSAVVWTSIATGKSMLKHGIVDWVFVNKQKIQVPYSSSEKRTPSIWEIMDEKGRRSVVLGWFVTDPPDAVKGVMVSDSFAPTLFRSFSRKEDPGDFSDTVYPRAEFKGLLEYFSRVEREGAFKYPRLVREMGIPDYLLEYRERYDEDTGRVPILGAWNSFLVYNRIEDLLVDRYLEKNDYDLFLAYYRFPDVFYHFGTLFLDKEYHDRIDALIENREPSAEDLAEFNLKMADVSLPLLKDKEALLEKIYDRAVKENAYLIIASDHGFRLTSKGYNHYGLPSGIPPPDGILDDAGAGRKTQRRSPSHGLRHHPLDPLSHRPARGPGHGRTAAPGGVHFPTAGPDHGLHQNETPARERKMPTATGRRSRN